MERELTKLDILQMAQEIEPTLSEDTLTSRSEWVTLGDRVVAEALNVLLSEGSYFNEEMGSVTEPPYIYFARIGRFIYIENNEGFMTYSEHDSTDNAEKHFNELQEMANYG